MKPGWYRYRTQDKCAVCGHGGRIGHASGCMFTGKADSPILVLCLRVKEGSFKEATGGMGWVHRIQEDPHRPQFAPSKPRQEAKCGVDLSALALQFQSALTDERLGKLGMELGLSVDSLKRLSMGWCEQYVNSETGELVTPRAWSFPMRGEGNAIVGIRLRDRRGKKYAVHGSKNGLFIPKRLDPTGPVWIVEGPTETATMTDWGFNAIGRPSNTAGLEYIVSYFKRFLPRRHAIIGRNNDPIGSDALRMTLMGVDALREGLLRAGACSSVSVVFPKTTKDFRDMKKQGATRQDVEVLLEEGV